MDSSVNPVISVDPSSLPYREFCTAIIYLPPAVTLWLQEAVTGIKSPGLSPSFCAWKTMQTS